MIFFSEKVFSLCAQFVRYSTVRYSFVKFLGFIKVWGLFIVSPHIHMCVCLMVVNACIMIVIIQLVTGSGQQQVYEHNLVLAG